MYMHVPWYLQIDTNVIQFVHELTQINIYKYYFLELFIQLTQIIVYTLYIHCIYNVYTMYIQMYLVRVNYYM